MYTLNHSYLKSMISCTFSISPSPLMFLKNFQIPWTSLKVQPPSNMAICKSREEVASLSEKYSTGRCIAAKLSIATPMPSIPWVLRMVTCPDRGQGVKSDFQNKNGKSWWKPWDLRTPKSLWLQNPTLPLFLKSEEIVQVIHCCTIRIHLMGDGSMTRSNSQTLKRLPVASLPAQNRRLCWQQQPWWCAAQGHHLWEREFIIYPENLERYRNLKSECCNAIVVCRCGVGIYNKFSLLWIYTTYTF